MHDTCNERIDDKTSKKLWQHSPPPAQGALPLGPYDSPAGRSHARRQVIQLDAQGWSKRSISGLLQVSRIPMRAASACGVCSPDRTCPNGPWDA